MNKPISGAIFFCLVFLMMSWNSNASTLETEFDFSIIAGVPDTVDNWQIYNGDQLVLGGYQTGNGFEGSIKKTEWKDVVIHYNRDTGFADGVSVKIEIYNESGTLILAKEVKQFKGKVTIKRAELAGFRFGAITIVYGEHSQHTGSVTPLGKITFK